MLKIFVLSSLVLEKLYLKYLKWPNIALFYNNHLGFPSWITKDINIFVNITLLSSLIMLFSSINWVFSRFTLYLEPYTFILMGYMIKNCFYGKEKRLLYFGIILCYTIFFFVECPSNLNGVPYKTNFNFNEFIYY